MSFLRLRASTSLARTIFTSSSSSRLFASASPLPSLQSQTSMLERIRSFSTTPVVEKMKSKRTLRLRVKPLAGGEFKRWKACGSHGLTTLSSSRLRRLGEPTLVKTRMMKQTMKKMLPYSR